MRLGRHTNGIHCEADMQKAFIAWMDTVIDLWNNKPFVQRRIVMADEVSVPEVNRIADFLVVYGNKGLVNIEAKCNDLNTLMKQLNDHATYCDYCFAYLPDYSLTPQWFKTALAEHGYGLIVYNWKTGAITEALEAHQNKKLNRPLRAKVVSSILKPKRQRNV